jgi:hypothetical protein
MKLQPIRSCSCGQCKRGRHCNRRELHRKVRRTARFLNLLRDPDDAQSRAHPAIAGGYTD